MKLVAGDRIITPERDQVWEWIWVVGLVVINDLRRRSLGSYDIDMMSEDVVKVLVVIFDALGKVVYASRTLARFVGI
jgi:hypothetical protein